MTPHRHVRVASNDGGREARRARDRRRLRRHARRDRGARRGRRRRRSSRSSTRPAATPAPPRAGSTRHSATQPRTTPRPRLRHRQGLRLPRRPGRDRDPLPRGARRHLPARALGSRLLASRGRPARAASVRRRRLAAHGLRGRHHRPRADPGALRAARKRDITVYEEFFAWQLVDRRRPLPGRDRVGPPARRPEGDRRQDDGPRHRRRRPPLPRDDERVRLHRRRHGDGAARRAAAEGHGVHAVPPDDAVPERDPDHRGLPRRGRYPASTPRASAS